MSMMLISMSLFDNQVDYMHLLCWKLEVEADLSFNVLALRVVYLGGRAVQFILDLFKVLRESEFGVFYF